MPPWVGQQFFRLEDPPLSVRLPQVKERCENGVRRLGHGLPPKGAELLDRDFAGYAQFHTRWYTDEERLFARRLFRPRAAVRRRMAVALDEMADQDATWVGVHLRRGDYGKEIFYITPVAWYLEKLRALWPTLVRPRLFVASEDLSLVPEFAAFEPVTAANLGVELDDGPLPNYRYLAEDLKARAAPLMDFFPDWYLLTRCDVLLIPNSSFSVTAAMMPLRVQCYRSVLSEQTFRRIDPWCCYPVQREHLDDFPDIEGVRRDD